MADYLTHADDWLDVPDGDAATTIGKLDNIFCGSQLDIGHGLIVRFADWCAFSFSCDDARPISRAGIRNGSQVYVRAVRTEDGMHATAIWEPGGVPIPLSNEGEPA